MNQQHKFLQRAGEIVDAAVNADKESTEFVLPDDVPWNVLHRLLYDSGDHQAIARHLKKYPAGGLDTLIARMAEATSQEDHLNSLEGRQKMYCRAFGKENW